MAQCGTQCACNDRLMALQAAVAARPVAGASADGWANVPRLQRVLGIHLLAPLWLTDAERVFISGRLCYKKGVGGEQLGKKSGGGRANKNWAKPLMAR